MLRTRQKKNAVASVIVCDRGGHRLGLDMKGVDRLVYVLLRLCRDPSVAIENQIRYPNGVDLYTVRSEQNETNTRRIEFVAFLRLYANLLTQ